MGVAACSGFPSTSIVVGGLDPLLDDAIELHARLRRVQVPVELKVIHFKYVVLLLFSRNTLSSVVCAGLPKLAARLPGCQLDSRGQACSGGDAAVVLWASS